MWVILSLPLTTKMIKWLYNDVFNLITWSGTHKYIFLLISFICTSIRISFDFLIYIYSETCLNLTSLGPTICVQKTGGWDVQKTGGWGVQKTGGWGVQKTGGWGVRFIQVILTKIFDIGTLFKDQFTQDFGLFRFQFRQDFGLFRVQFTQDSGLFRVQFTQDFGLFRVQFRQDFGLFRVQFRQDSQYNQ